jgi:hypothetical protein
MVEIAERRSGGSEKFKRAVIHRGAKLLEAAVILQA